MFRVERFWAVGGLVGNFCSGFVRLPLHKCRFCHAGVPAKVMRVKDCPHVFQAMPGEGGNLSFTTSAKRKPGHGSSAKVVEGQPGHFRLGDNLAPRGAESVGSPRRAVRRGQDGHGGLGLGGIVQRRLQFAADGNVDAPPALALPQADVLAVLGRPRQPQQVALPLARPDGQEEGKPQVRRRHCLQGGFIIGQQDRLGALRTVSLARPCAGVGQDQAPEYIRHPMKRLGHPANVDRRFRIEGDNGRRGGRGGRTLLFDEV